ncbi:hypothetical protein HYV82_04905 [Candidatus Woesearchaeota archaeon]|nr:hypothetical protein [Candidatus Woesearchaeota archaeon]
MDDLWYVSRFLPEYVPGPRPRVQIDSKPTLEELGFQILNPSGDHLYEVRPPQGWTTETQGFWTYMKDQSGVRRIQQFLKIGDGKAFLEKLVV